MTMIDLMSNDEDIDIVEYERLISDRPEKLRTLIKGEEVAFVSFRNKFRMNKWAKGKYVRHDNEPLHAHTRFIIVCEGEMVHFTRERNALWTVDELLNIRGFVLAKKLGI